MTDEANPKDLSFGKKPPLSLVPPSAIVLIAMAMKDGAIKRSAYNWRDSKVSVMQLLDKVLRHTYKFLDGQDIDEESGISELAHAAADLCVLIDAIETKSTEDDRPTKGNASELIKKNSESKKLTEEDLYKIALEVEADSTFKPWEEEFYSDNGGYNCPCGCRGVEE